MISVVITCYNEESYIGHAIESVIGQTAWSQISEIIVVDDGSVDSSEKVIRGFTMRFPKIKYVYQANQGLSKARNTGIELSKEEYIAFLDGDDLWKEDKIEKQVSFLGQHPRVGLLYTNYILINGKSKPRAVTHYSYDQKHVLPRYFLKGGPIIPSTVMVRRECFHKVGKFDPKLRKAQDTDMWLRIAAEYPIHHLRDYLVFKRERENSLGANVEDKAYYLNEVVNKVTALYPMLKPLRDRKRARILTGVGYYHLSKGNQRNGRAFLARAIKLDKMLLKAYFYYLVTLLPFENRMQVVRFVKELRRDIAVMIGSLSGIKIRRKR